MFSSRNNQLSSGLTGWPLAPPFPRTQAGGYPSVGCRTSRCGSPFSFLDQTICRNTALSIMPRSVKELAERRVQEKLDGAMALIEYQTQEQATRLLTAKLRAERLARESKPRRKRKA